MAQNGLVEKLLKIQEIMADILENELNIKGKTREELVAYNEQLTETADSELKESARLAKEKLKSE